MALKRFVDAALSFLALLFLSPFLAVIALAVWLDSGSPILFHQERVGMAFRHFQIHKFRTMRVHTKGPMLTVAGDRRVAASRSVAPFSEAGRTSSALECPARRHEPCWASPRSSRICHVV